MSYGQKHLPQTGDEREPKTAVAGIVGQTPWRESDKPRFTYRT
ncbi:MAG: hypothetical protein ACYC24_00035 [Desulfobacteria bacterium]